MFVFSGTKSGTQSTLHKYLLFLNYFSVGDKLLFKIKHMVLFVECCMWTKGDYFANFKYLS